MSRTIHAVRSRRRARHAPQTPAPSCSTCSRLRRRIDDIPTFVFQGQVPIPRGRAVQEVPLPRVQERLHAGGRRGLVLLAQVRSSEPMQPRGIMTVHRYYLPQLSNWEDGWSIVLVDQEMGILSIASDWGNFMHVWGPWGRVFSDFREELLRFDDGYLENKLADHKNLRFDSDGTIKLMRELIVLRRRAGGMTRQEARTDWDDMGDISDVDDWRDFLESKGRWIRYWEDAQYEPANLWPLQQWLRKSWPRLRALMRVDIDRERQEASQARIGVPA